MARARQGDADAYAALVKRYTPDLYAFLAARVPRPVVADLAQETWLNAWRAIGSFRGLCSFRTWLYRIGLNLASRELKRRKRAAPWSDELAHAEPAQALASERIETADEHQELQRLMASLPAIDCELIHLLYRDQLSYEEISHLMGMPLGTVKVRLHRARQRLRAQLEERWEAKSR